MVSPVEDLKEGGGGSARWFQRRHCKAWDHSALVVERVNTILLDRQHSVRPIIIIIITILFYFCGKRHEYKLCDKTLTLAFLEVQTNGKDIELPVRPPSLGTPNPTSVEASPTGGRRGGIYLASQSTTAPPGILKLTQGRQQRYYVSATRFGLG